MEVPLTRARTMAFRRAAALRDSGSTIANRTDLYAVTAQAEMDRPPAGILGTVAAARSGDEHALEEVIRHYQNRIAAYVVSLVGSGDADLDDLCQIVFVKMALALPRLGAVDAFEAWLFTIARNVCRDHLRRFRMRNRMVPLSRDHEAIAAEPAKEDAEVAPPMLDAALDRLSNEQRRLIDLLREREYSYEELARLTRSSVRAVASRLFRARARLRLLLGNNGAEP